MSVSQPARTVVQAIEDAAASTKTGYRFIDESTDAEPFFTHGGIERASARYGAPLTVTTGVIPARQPLASLAAFASVVAGCDDFALTALHTATTAGGSLVIALALLEGRLDAGAAFAASQLDESFQIEAWGEDKEQAERRGALAADIAAAARLISLLGG